MNSSTGTPTDLAAGAASEADGEQTAAGGPRVPYILIVGAVALATGLFMAFVVSSGGSRLDTTFDPYGYGEMGLSVSRGDGFEGFGSVLDRRGPFYPLVIGAVYYVFGERERAVLVLHCLMFAGTAMLACDLARRHFNQRTGLIAGLLCAFHPLLLRYVPSLHVETIITFLTTLLVWCTYRFYRHPTVLNGAFVGVVAGMGALTKAVILFYPAVFVVALLLTFRAARRRGASVRVPWGALATVLVATGLTIAPWTIRNYASSGHFVPITTGTGDAFLRGFIFSRWEFVTLQEPPYEVAENESNAYLRSVVVAELGEGATPDDYETDQILTREARRRLFAEPEQVARKTFFGFFAFWYQLTSLKNSLLVGAVAIGAWVLAIIGWRRARARGIAVWPFFLPVFYVNIVLALLISVGRYSSAIMPALLVVSAYGLDTILDRWRPARGANDGMVAETAP